MAILMSKNGVIVKPKDFNVIGGKRYKTVRLPDGKIWLAENLDFKFCSIGGNLSDGRPHAWYYNNDETTYGWNGYKCGLLYNFQAIKILNNNRADLCPGWHVATKSEYDNLFSIATINEKPKLRSVDNSIVQGFPSGWKGTNESGFSAIPTGWARSSFGGFDVGGVNAHFTTWAYDISTSSRYGFDIDVGSGNPWSGTFNESDGYAIRLVRDPD